jgi:hypothetical protein
VSKKPNQTGTSAGAQHKSRRGGVRLGPDGKPLQGRRKKVFAPPTAVSDLDLAAALAVAPPAEVDAVAQDEAHSSIAALVKQIVFGASEPAKVSACVVILDRGYGKPAVEIGGDAAMLPFMMAPDAQGQASVSVTAEIRAEARKFAVLAIECLKRIRDKGTSEQARVSAARALLDRGLGTVGKARMPDEQRERPLGKKEEASRAAEAAATGRFATPAPPGRQLERVQ